MSAARSFAVTMGVSRRSAVKIVKNPVMAFAPLAVPLFMFAAFAGAMTAVGKTPGFDYYNYTAFIFVFVLYQAMVFVGIFTGIEMSGDFGQGFGDRMMLAAPQRLAIVGGYVLFTIGRGLLTIAIVWAVALATGMPVKGQALEIAGIVALALMLGVATTLWAAGIALRARSITAAALIFMSSFVVLFMTPDFVPRHLLTGWLKTAATINPLTPPVEAGRAYLAHTHAKTALAFGVTAALIVAFTLWAVRGMKAAEQGPKAPRARGPRARREAKRANLAAGLTAPAAPARGPAARRARMRERMRG
jgi:ABC-2 type transport system permease protein